jgi:uncharacterized iron-regulated membrane protein
MRLNLLQFFRNTHLYVGVFTAPAILFFALTGSLQTFSLHEAARDGSYKPAQWIQVLAQIHKKQTDLLPQRKVPPSATAAGSQKKTESSPPSNPASQSQPPAAPSQRNPLPLRIFFLIVGLSLSASTASGLYLAWKYRRDRVVIAVLLLAGILAPLAMMRL